MSVKVKLKKGLRINNKYGGLTLWPSMRFRGTKTAIRDAANFYMIKVGSYDYSFTKEMLDIIGG